MKEDNVYIRKIPFRLHNGHYSSAEICTDSSGRLISSLIGLKHYTMKGPTFPPYPCAGILLFTYVLEYSKGSIRASDSAGHKTIISPGELACNKTNNGVVYNETMLNTRDETEAVQVLIKIPEEYLGENPLTFHAKESEIKIIRKGANRVKVLLGKYNKTVCQSLPFKNINLYELRIYESEAVSVDAGTIIYIYQVAGRADVSTGLKNYQLSSSDFFITGCDREEKLIITPEEYSHLMIICVPASKEHYFRKNFICMSDEKEVEKAISRYMEGEMGLLNKKFP